MRIGDRVICTDCGWIGEVISTVNGYCDVVLTVDSKKFTRLYRIDTREMLLYTVRDLDPKKGKYIVNLLEFRRSNHRIGRFYV